MTSLDLFLVGLINAGINTPYLLRERASLSVGATLPALSRLENAGLVEREPKAERNRQQFAVTKSGRKHLKRGLETVVREFAHNPPSDAETALRVSALCVLLGKTRDAKKCLELAAEGRARRSASGEMPRSDISEPELAGLYTNWLRAVQAARTNAESEVLSEIAKSLSARNRSEPK